MSLENLHLFLKPENNIGALPSKKNLPFNQENLEMLAHIIKAKI